MDEDQNYEFFMQAQSDAMSRIGALCAELSEIHKKLDAEWRMDAHNALVSRKAEIESELEILPCRVGEASYNLACLHLAALQAQAQEARKQIDTLDARIAEIKSSPEFVVKQNIMLQRYADMHMAGSPLTREDESAYESDCRALQTEFYQAEISALTFATNELDDSHKQAERYGNARLDNPSGWPDCAESYALEQYRGAVRYRAQSLNKPLDAPKNEGVLKSMDAPAYRWGT
jgi:hypothetical protein